MFTWKKFRTANDIPFLIAGAVLTVYIAFAAFGFLKNSSEHYSNFILGTCLMTGLLAVRKLCEEKIHGNSQRFFEVRFAFAVFALVTSAVAMGYVRLNAVTLEQTQPFFNDTDMIFGWLMTISILALTLIHWGMLLTSVIAISIAYFFLGHLIENPLFMTPEYDHKFVMNYIGLGTNQGFYYLAQVAAFHSRDAEWMPAASWYEAIHRLSDSSIRRSYQNSPTPEPLCFLSNVFLRVLRDFLLARHL